jgi:hypothetical protein
MLPRIGYAPNVLKAAFAMKKEIFRQAVQTPRGSAIVKVTDVKEPGIPDFAEAKSKVAANCGAGRKTSRSRPPGRSGRAARGSTLDAVAKRFRSK